MNEENKLQCITCLTRWINLSQWKHWVTFVSRLRADLHLLLFSPYVNTVNCAIKCRLFIHYCNLMCLLNSPLIYLLAVFSFAVNSTWNFKRNLKPKRFCLSRGIFKCLHVFWTKQGTKSFSRATVWRMIYSVVMEFKFCIN